LKLPSKLKWLVLAQLLLMSFAISLVVGLFGGRSAGVGVFTFFALLIVLPLWLLPGLLPSLSAGWIRSGCDNRCDPSENRRGSHIAQV